MMEIGNLVRAVTAPLEGEDLHPGFEVLGVIMEILPGNLVVARWPGGSVLTFSVFSLELIG